jgi:hypothetical protein
MGAQHTFFDEISRDVLRMGCGPAFHVLFDAYFAAVQVRKNPTDFAIALPLLSKQGISETVLRWLAANHLIEHRVPHASQAKEAGLCQLSTCANFTCASRFVLTQLGFGLALEVLWQAPCNHVEREDGHLTVGAGIPRYDGVSILWLGEVVVKQFEVPAENQKLILLAFEEENWLPRIDDPLPGKSGINRKKRLNKAISGLNHAQTNPLIRFHGDGTGQGIAWEIADGGNLSIVGRSGVAWDLTMANNDRKSRKAKVSV